MKKYPVRTAIIFLAIVLIVAYLSSCKEEAPAPVYPPCEELQALYKDAMAYNTRIHTNDNSSQADKDEADQVLSGYFQYMIAGCDCFTCSYTSPDSTGSFNRCAITEKEAQEIETKYTDGNDDNTIECLLRK